MNLALLLLGLLCLAAWLMLGFVAPVGAGWVHLFLPAGVLLLMRRVELLPPAEVATALARHPVSELTAIDAITPAARD